MQFVVGVMMTDPRETVSVKGAMENKAMGNLLTNVAVALFAGALGGVITLAATQRFAVTTADVAPAEINLPAGPVSVVAPVESDAAFEIISEPEPDPPMIQLKAAIDEAAAERSQLAATLVSLTRQIDELEADLINYSGRMAGIAFDSSTDARASSEAFPQGGEALDEVSGNGRRQGMDRAEQRYQNLLAAGIDEQTALQLQQRSDQYQLARLELFDRAAREGWTDSEQLSSELEVLDETQVDLREALGDEAYDRYLYQAGRPNRVEIASIITGSAADMA